VSEKKTHVGLSAHRSKYTEDIYYIYEQLWAACQMICDEIAMRPDA